MGLPFALLHVGARLSWTEFTVHPSTVVGLGALGALYGVSRALRSPRFARGDASGQAARGTPEPGARTRTTLFGAGLALMFFALNGWVHDLSDYYLFTAHMVQHLLLAMGVAPLLIMGTPGWMLRPLLRLPPGAAAARLLANPIACFAIFNIVLVGWHLPPLYNAAMTYHELHILQHLLLLSASVIMWWPVLSPVIEIPRLSYPGQMLYLFLMTIPMSLVSVSIAYSGSVLYPAYASAPRVMRLSPLEDQMLGGLTMWIPGGLYFFAVISVISAQVDVVTVKS
jgi:putative membrane protein